jgi:hypothetical protein
MKAGNAFRIPEPGTSLDSHFWVVISDPSVDPERVLIVYFTTLDMTSGGQSSPSRPGENDWEVIMVMAVAIAVSTAVNDYRIVQQ